MASKLQPNRNDRSESPALLSPRDPNAERSRVSEQVARALQAQGDLDRAARIFERIGAHDRAAESRLEHAATLRDEEHALAVLREGCARNPPNSPEGRALHLAYAEALMARADLQASAAETPRLLLDAARAYDDAGKHRRAGELFEALELLPQAARAYERAGAITQLELVLLRLEGRRRDAKDAARTVQTIERAAREGRRREAIALGRERLDAHLPKDATAASLQKLLLDLESRWIRRPSLDFSTSRGDVLRVVGAPTLTFGRSPASDIQLTASLSSRDHATLRLEERDGLPHIAVVDHGSRSGTFWQGDALTPEVPVPIVEPGELAFGASETTFVYPMREPALPSRPALFCKTPSGSLMFLPSGEGPLALGPDLVLPIRLHFERDHVGLTAGLGMRLNATAIPSSTRIDLLQGDTLHFPDLGFTLDVRGP